MTRSYKALTVSLAFLLLQGCYHFRLDSKAPFGTEVKKKTMHSLFWGLVQPSTIDSCDDKGVTDVRYSTNLGYQVLSIVSLGIWVPVDVEFRCAKRPPPRPDDQ